MRALSGLLIFLVSCLAIAAVPPVAPSCLELDYSSLSIPVVTGFSAEDFKAIDTKWKSRRSVASEFSESELSPDFVKVRDQYLKAKTADDIQTLLDDSYKNYANYSADVQFFLAQVHVGRQLRGIVWKLRPIFENARGFLGNKATHVAAIQFVRTTVTGLHQFFPASHSRAWVDYLTQPSTQMSSADQFSTIYKFQQFLAGNFVSALNESAERMKVVMKNSADAVWKWDNKIIFGEGSFLDGVNRIMGYSAAEMHLAVGGTYEAIHDALVFSAYNQDQMLVVAGQLGKEFGINSWGLGWGDDVGMTDQKRNGIIRYQTDKYRFLELRDYKGTTYGSELMRKAFIAKKSAIDNFVKAYQKLEGRGANPAMALNPVLFQKDVQPRLRKGIENMAGFMEGPKEVRDPVSGLAVTLNVPAFYTSPPKTLKVLMANGFEGGQSQMTIKGKNNESLTYRNYYTGRSNSWDNVQWAAYVPSASGKSANYMSDARRALHFALGTAPVFAQIDLFVR